MKHCSLLRVNFSVIWVMCFLSVSVPPPDPNAPKPEGSTITPTVGEQLIVSKKNNIVHTPIDYLVTICIRIMIYEHVTQNVTLKMCMLCQCVTRLKIRRTFIGHCNIFVMGIPIPGKFCDLYQNGALVTWIYLANPSEPFLMVSQCWFR